MLLRITIAILAILAGICAYLGHLEENRMPGREEFWLHVNAFAGTMQIFPRGAGVTAKSPDLLQAARALALLTSALAAFELWRHYFYRAASRVRLRLWRGHTLICGFDRKGRRLAAVLRGQNARVGVIEKKVDATALANCRELGAALLDGDSLEGLVLQQAGVERAAGAYVVCGSDQNNLEIAMQILARYRQAGASQPFECHVHVVRLALLELLQRQSWMDGERGFALRFFNIHQNTARLLFADFPLEGYPVSPGVQAGGGVHLILVGFGDLGEAILLQAAAIGHFPGEKKLQVTVVCGGSAAREVDFLSRQPKIHSIIDLQFAERPPIERTDPLGQSLPEQAAQARTVVVVALEDDAENITSALRIANWRGERDIPILVQIAEREGLANLLSANRGRLAAQNIQTFGEVERVCDPETLLGIPLDRMARTIHEVYLRNFPPPNDGFAAPSQRPWDRLPEDFKQASRAQADHIEVKLRLIGCEIVCGQDELFAFTEGEIDMLSKIEHRRWMADRILTGWLPAAQTDKQKKFHASLVPWEELSEDEKQKDRDAVLAIPELAAQAGFSLRRSAAQF